MRASTVTLTAVPGLPLVKPGDDLCGLLIAAIDQADIAPRSQDVLVIAQKIVSKAEDRYVDLADIVPSARARELAADVDKDPRLIEVILSESEQVVRYKKGVLIVAHRLGFVMANAGVDQSNIERVDGHERVLILPANPDASCTAIKARLDTHYGVELGIVINDSFGRPWRNGVVGVALGASGIPALLDLVGQPDLFGRPLRVTEVAVADEIAAAASLLMGQARESRPVVHVRGLTWTTAASGAAALVRPRERDLFR